MNEFGSKKVLIFGIGGVGGYVADTLARAGVGKFTLVDSDKVEESNLNRQIIATKASVGRYKTEVMKERILSINPNCEIEVKNLFFDSSTNLVFSGFDCIIDAIDSVPSKLEILSRAERENVPVVSAMGAGKRRLPTLFKMGMLYETTVCPLAKKIRKSAKLLGLKDVPVLYSVEQPSSFQNSVNEKSGARAPLGSISYSVATAGMLVAYYVLDNILSREP